MEEMNYLRIPINGQSADELRPSNGQPRGPQEPWRPPQGDINPASDLEASSCSPITLEYAEDLLLLAKKVKYT